MDGNDVRELIDRGRIERAERRAEIERLRAALRGQTCPAGGDTVGNCVDTGWCGCDNGPALVEGYKPTANEQLTHD